MLYTHTLNCFEAVALLLVIVVFEVEAGAVVVLPGLLLLAAPLHLPVAVVLLQGQHHGPRKQNNRI